MDDADRNFLEGLILDGNLTNAEIVTTMGAHAGVLITIEDVNRCRNNLTMGRKTLRQVREERAKGKLPEGVRIEMERLLARVRGAAPAISGRHDKALDPDELAVFIATSFRTLGYKTRFRVTGPSHGVLGIWAEVFLPEPGAWISLDASAVSSGPCAGAGESAEDFFEIDP